LPVALYYYFFKNERAVASQKGKKKIRSFTTRQNLKTKLKEDEIAFGRNRENLRKKASRKKKGKNQRRISERTYESSNPTNADRLVM